MPASNNISDVKEDCNELNFLSQPGYEELASQRLVFFDILWVFQSFKIPLHSFYFRSKLEGVKNVV